MYITVKFGHNESLLCNPSCAVVNLLSSIKRRAGYKQMNVCLDLSDENGLVKDLDIHKYDYATKFLSSHGTYILVEKQLIQDENGNPETDSIATPIPPQYTYVPLLDNYDELFPNYKLHVSQVEKKKHRSKSSKSQSPAGMKGTKVRSKVSATPSFRSPSRKR